MENLAHCKKGIGKGKRLKAYSVKVTLDNVKNYPPDGPSEMDLKSPTGEFDFEHFNKKTEKISAYGVLSL